MIQVMLISKCHILLEPFKTFLQRGAELGKPYYRYFSSNVVYVPEAIHINCMQDLQEQI